MAGRTLEEYFVSLGIKGQNVVLSNIKKIKKEAGELTKPKTVNVKAKAGLFGGVFGNNIIPPQQTQPDTEQKKENKKLVEGINKFANGSKEFVKGVAHFDPVSAVQQAITSGGSALSAGIKAIPVIGDYLQNLPKGLADVTNSLVGMASSAVEVAKSTAANQYAISNRNAITEYYGGDLKQSSLSNVQYAELITSISSSYGKLKEPLKGILDELTASKNTEALGRVASGNWASIGDDRGWMLQQISNQTAGLPPSIAQAIQTALLQNNKDLILNKGGERGAQDINRDWVNAGESQTAEIFTKTSEKHRDLLALNSDLNKMQAKMIETGAGLSTVVNSATESITKLVTSFNKLTEGVNKAKDEVQNSRLAPQWFKEMFGK